jgi:hypothetical protein
MSVVVVVKDTYYEIHETRYWCLFLFSFLLTSTAYVHLCNSPLFLAEMTHVPSPSECHVFWYSVLWRRVHETQLVQEV